MNKKNAHKGKYFLYVIVFLVTATITFISGSYETESSTKVTMAEATLPIIMVNSEAQHLYNPMYGYVMDIDEKKLDTCITPIKQNNILNLVIYTYGIDVSELSFKIRDTRDWSLIENSKIEDYEVVESRLNANIEFKNLISDDVKYLVEIILKVDDREVKYYTTVLRSDDMEVDKKLDYVLNFNKSTYDVDAINNIKKYLETSQTADNSNYGLADIHSSVDVIGWGDMNPVISGDVVPSIIEIDSDMASIMLSYKCVYEGKDGDNETFNVKEHYRIKQGTRDIYLLNYDRKSDKIFDGNNALSSDGINMGIKSDNKLDYINSNDNTCTYFIDNGNIWMYSLKDNTINEVFSFDSDDSNNLYNRGDTYNIKIMSIDDSNNINFVVYGYMSRGVHEGEVGISLYNYNMADNKLDELLFIPVKMPYDIMKHNVCEVAYLNQNNSFYVSIDDTIYSIELSSKEVMTEITNLQEGLFEVSDNGRQVAYSLNGQIDETNSIRIIDFENQTEKVIDAEEGKYLKTIGFINSDFVYGIADGDDIIKDENGITVFPMYKVVIVNREYEEIKTYEVDGVYVSEASVDGMRLNLNRVVKNGDNSYTATSIDQLINREENNQNEENTIDSMTTSLKLKEIILKLYKGVGDPQKVVLKESNMNKFDQNKIITVGENAKFERQLYYAYTSQKQSCAYKNINDAINYAGKNNGYVKDSNNIIVWSKYKNSSAILKGISVESGSKDESYELAKQAVVNYHGGGELHEVGIKGLSVENVLPFISEGNPVIVRTNKGYGIIVAYDSGNISYITAVNSEKITLSYVNANKEFSEVGSEYVLIY